VWVTRVLVRSVRRAIRKGRSRAPNEPVRRKAYSNRTRGSSYAVGGRSPGGRSSARLLVAAATRRRNTTPAPLLRSCPEGAREAKRGAVASDGSRPAVRWGIPGRRRNGLPGAPNQYGRYAPHPNLWKHAKPHEGPSGGREADPLARADPDTRRTRFDALEGLGSASST
jgi:hypothetical protein